MVPAETIAMHLEDHTLAVLLLDDHQVTDSAGAIEAILTHLAERSLIPAPLVGELREAIFRRDELGPTGIGEGVAIPHAAHPGLARIIVALAVSRPGLDYPSLDGELVHIILLLLAPLDRSAERPKQTAFDTWLRRLRDPAFRASLRLASSTEELQAAIRIVDRTGA
jgi:mannitol/fructose-specific phosphotransferase system IIA component (Ntr-type)